MGASIPVGTTLGRYRVVSQLGAGGMGEVYLAHDTQLHSRPVALKILRADLSGRKSQLDRFEQEAYAASNLNHPHILTVYEIGEADSVRFIATEFVDGQTLRERQRQSPLGLRESLHVCEQVASALSAAHAAGIVHRDVKPENIMARRDGYVKVLDFGLAKLTEKHAASADSEAATRALVSTSPGVVMGTFAYMSPEQARGLAVDERTDIWSLGCVLYELVAHRLPFDGRTPTDVLAQIIHKDPPALRLFDPEAPDELERIVTKALAKEADERYQTAKDLMIDLRRLRQKLEVDAEIERTVPPAARAALRGGSQTTAHPSAQPPQSAQTAHADAAQTASAASAQPTSSAEYVARAVGRHKFAVVAAVAALVVAASALVAYRLYAARKIDSIAVLPLVNVGGDPNVEYLSDGISESLINSLTELQQLRVVARSTAFRYKGRDVDPQQVGRELNVRAVLTGRVRQLGDSLDVQVDLVDAQTGAQLWGEEYERKASDLLSVKQDIAREVTEKLRLRLSSEERQRLAKSETTNAEAYQSYLRGRYYWNKRTPEGLRKAVEQFQQAIDRDPNYALGYVGLADCYLVFEERLGVPSAETMPKAKAAVDRALQLDDSLAEAHTSAAFIYHDLWRWDEADGEFKRAIALNPNYPTAHHWYAHYFRVQRQFDDALRESKRAQELDPLSPVIGTNVGLDYLLKGETDSAVEQFGKVIEFDPSYPAAHDRLGYAYLRQRRYEEAVAELQKAVELSGRASEPLGDLGYGYAFAGRRAEALAVVKELEEKYARRETTGQYLALVYAGLGDKDQAFQWLEKDYAQRSALLPRVAWWFAFDDLRSDPRYADLLRRMVLTP